MCVKRLTFYFCKDVILLQAMINNIEMGEAPFGELNTLEEQCISPVVPFDKIDFI